MKTLKKYLSKKEYVVFMVALLVIMFSMVSYAFYISTDEVNNNIAKSECFKITFEDENEINIEKAYPMSEEEGSNLRPYKFTIKNICQGASSYQVNIETIDESTMETLYLRSKIDDNTSNVMGTLDNVTTYVNDNIKESRKIAEGILLANEEVTYNLRVWIDENATVEQTADKIWRGKVVVISSLNKDPYKEVVLNASGGYLETNTISVVDGRAVGTLPSPTRNGFTFNGWYDEAWVEGESHGNQITEYTTISEDQEIYANYNRNNYDLTIDPNSGEYNNSPSSQTISLAYEEEQELLIPEKVGYTFKDWTIDKESTTYDSNTHKIKMGYEDTTLTANYEINSYTLKIEDSYTCDGEYTLEYNTSKEICTPEREGYTFDGWTVPSGTLNGETYTIGASDVTITANWTANNYKWIAYHNKQNVDGNGYTLVSADTDEGEAKYNTTVTPSVKTYTGFTSPSSQTMTIRVENNYPPTTNKIDYNYTRFKGTLTIKRENGSTNETKNNVYYESTQTIANPSKSCNTFSSWSVSGTGSSFNGTTFTMGYQNTTITANYTINKYTITYNANGGSVSPGSAQVNCGSTLSLPTPTRSGYTFDGWYTDATNGTQVTNSTTWTSTQTIYAHWKINGATDTIQSIIAGSSTTSTDVIDKGTDSTGCTNTLAYDGTTDNNLRYVGKNPCNYVTYNGETAGWRIIGVFNNVKTNSAGTTKETLIKIIRKTSLGSYSWDTSVTGTNNGWGINQWGASGSYEGADLMRELNYDYLGTTNVGSTWYNGTNNSKSASKPTTTLNSTAQNMIQQVVWNTGSTDKSGSTNWTASKIYSYERGNINGKLCSSGQYCNDSVTRTTTWYGKVALMYPSDFSYATAGGSLSNRTTCLATSLYSWDGLENTNINDCRNNDWLYNSSYKVWTLSTGYDLKYYNTNNYDTASWTFYFYSGGGLRLPSSQMVNDVLPVVFLESSVKITGGSGTSSNPYTLG